MISISEKQRNEFLQHLYSVRRTVVRQHRIMSLRGDEFWTEVRETEEAVTSIDKLIGPLVLATSEQSAASEEHLDGPLHKPSDNSMQDS